ncbi:Hypp561 [Branchiostoma lanceolatum]|uniref:Hypp561 protein n=1 Tax=Branchiostoma lanceolatum TaxID=7740 RepID=A0A8J9YR35_BRALA|nr:Hypp561 [Branchiostoma lanceolatum]
MHEESEEEKTPLLGDGRHSESCGTRKKEAGTEVVKLEDEEDGIKTGNSTQGEGAEGYDGARKARKKLRRKNNKKVQENPDVTNLKPGATVADLQREVEELEHIVRDNAKKLVEHRDRQLKNVMERTERLDATAGDFARVSTLLVVRTRLRTWLRG